jgi:hypothetical protein
MSQKSILALAAAAAALGLVASAQEAGLAGGPLSRAADVMFRLRSKTTSIRAGVGAVSLPILGAAILAIAAICISIALGVGIAPDASRLVGP